MLWVLVLILFSVVRSSHQTIYSCNASASCGCSTNSAVVTRIIGGENATSSTWGWTVSILIGGSYLCGGSIISSSWIITAAHCVYGFKGSQVTIYAGSIVRFSGTQTRTASYVIVHPNYNSQTFVNDIALLLLASPLDMTDPQVSQICLPTVNSTILSAGEWPTANTSVVTVGWGKTNTTSTSTNVLPLNLQQVTVLTVSYQASTCTPVMTDWHVQMCGGVNGGGKDACQGDSGGPLMMFSSNNQWILVGLTSNGVGCALATSSGVYTRVAYFQDWIASTMNATYSHQVSTYQISFLVLSLSTISTLLQTYG